MVKHATLGFIVVDGKILLGRKKYGQAKGILNGFGGKVEEADRSIKFALIREFKEETSLDIIEPQLKGQLCFKDGDTTVVIHVYLIDSFTGIPVESKEMSVEWYDYEAVDTTEMWFNDRIWFPYLMFPVDFVFIWSGKEVCGFSSKCETYFIENIDNESYKAFID